MDGADDQLHLKETAERRISYVHVLSHSAFRFLMHVYVTPALHFAQINGKLLRQSGSPQKECESERSGAVVMFHLKGPLLSKSL